MSPSTHLRLSNRPRALHLFEQMRRRGGWLGSYKHNCPSPKQHRTPIIHMFTLGTMAANGAMRRGLALQESNSRMEMLFCFIHGLRYAMQTRISDDAACRCLGERGRSNGVLLSHHMCRCAAKCQCHPIRRIIGVPLNDIFCSHRVPFRKKEGQSSHCEVDGTEWWPMDPSILKVRTTLCKDC
jgi:hypothetical protein